MCRPPVPADAARGEFRCSECGKCVSTEIGFRRHVAMHKGEYQYRCEICGRGCSSMNSLKGHLVRHTGVKAFVCHICKRSFSYSSSMTAHVKQFHPEHASWTGRPIEAKQ